MANLQIPSPSNNKRPTNVYEWLGFIQKVMKETKGIDWHLQNTLNIKQLGDSIGNDRNFVQTVDNKIAESHKPVELSSTADLNTLTETGLFSGGFDGESSTILNRPNIPGSFILRVYKVVSVDGRARTIQILYCRRTGDSYTRLHDETTGWSQWIRALKQTDVSVNADANKLVIRDANGNIKVNTIIGSLQGNSDSATKLKTPRKINGTNFDGTQDITTANWGTARNFTIGKTSKSVNGSTNMSWTLDEMGALPTAGGTMTGSIRFSGGGYSGPAIQMEAGDNNGGAYIGVGAGGLTIIGSGESTGTVRSNISNGSVEQMIVASDNDIIFNTNLQNGYETRKTVTITSAGVVDSPQGFKGALNGNASTATKLATARNIALGGAMNGSASFDGSSNITINTNRQSITVGTETDGLVQWYLVASKTMAKNSDAVVMFSVNSTYSIYAGGILRLHVRSSSTGTLSNMTLDWLVNTGLDINHFVIVYDNTTWKLFAKTTKRWQYLDFTVISMNSRTRSISTEVSIPSTIQTFSDLPTGTVEYSKLALIQNTSTEANKLNSFYSRRQSSLDIAAVGDGSLTTFKATSENHNHSSYPGKDGHILHFEWDNDAGWSSQLFLGASSDYPIIKTRAMKNHAWGEWNTFYSTHNKPTPSEIGAAPSSHTHTSAQISDATASNNANTVVKRDGNGNFSAGTITATLNGTANYSKWLAQDSSMTYGWNGVNYFNINGTAGNAAKVNDTPTTAWWHIMRFNHQNNSGFYTDLAIPFNTTSLYYKRITSGSVQNGGWVKVLDALNYNEFTPTKTGGGASGSWGISVTGNAATATKLQTARSINGTNFDGTGNITTANWGTARNIQIGNTSKSVNGSGNVTWSHSEMGVLPTSGGTMTGSIRFSGGGYSGPAIQMEAGDGNGAYIGIGAGGLTVIGSGESTATVRSNISNGTEEKMIIASDADITFHTNLQNGYGSRKTVTITSAGVVDSPQGFKGALNGNASTATKLATSRLIGSTNFDGTSNITVSEILGNVSGTATRENTNKYQKIARITVGTTTWAIYSGILHIMDSENTYFCGSLWIYVKTTDAVNKQIGVLQWLSLNTINYMDKIYLTKVSDGVFDLYLKIPDGYVTPRYHVIDFLGAGRLTLTANQPLVDSISSILFTSSFPIAATKLQTARTINGTNFDGTANITTANWGTGRNIQIGNTSKSVNGSGNVSWSHSEMGVLPLTGGTLTGELRISSGSKTLSLGVGGSDVYISNSKSNRYLQLKDSGELRYSNWLVYSEGYKPTPADIGAAAASHNHGFLDLKNTNTISGTSNDTVANWGREKNSVHYFNTTGKLIDQPSQYGFVLNLTTGGGEVHQIWATQASGNLAHRGGNGSGWSGTWRIILDSSNYNSYAPTKTGGGASGTWGISVTGNASTATTLQTAKTINGTSFNGSGNITTANWGTARTITIGSTGKSVNGSGNVSWSHSEMGVLPLTGGTLTGELRISSGSKTLSLGVGGSDVYISNSKSNRYLQLKDSGELRYSNWLVYSEGYKPTPADIGAAAASHNHGFLDLKNTNTISGTSNDTVANWGREKNSVHYFNTTGKLIDQPSQYGFVLNLTTGGGEVHQIWATQASGNLAHRGGNGSGWSGTWRIILDSSNYNSYAPTKTGGGASGTWGISVTGNASTATTLQTAKTINGTSFNGSGNITTANWGTARTITIGSTGKSVNGSGNVSWSLSEIGAVPVSTGSSITIHADSDASSTGEYLLLKAGHNELKILSSAGGTTSTKGADKLTFNGSIVYHAGRKPTPADIGAAAASHTHTSAQISDATASNNANTVVKRDGSGNFNAGRITLSNWLYCSGNTGIYFNTHGGGWYMTDSTWLRAYGDKSIYTKNDIKADGKLYAGSAQINGAMNATGWVSGSGVTSGGGWYEVNKGEAMKLRSGSGNIIVMPVEGTSMVQLYPNGNNTGNLGTADMRWSRIYTVNGMNQSSDSRYKTNIETVNTSDCFEMIKNIDVYTYILLGEDKRKLSRQQLIEKTEENKNNIEIGVIAQDIAKFKYGKYIVEKGDSSENEDSFYAISPYNLTSATIAALKEEINLRESLESEVSSLNNKVETLKSEIEELKSLVTQLLNR